MAGPDGIDELSDATRARLQQAFDDFRRAAESDEDPDAWDPDDEPPVMGYPAPTEADLSDSDSDGESSGAEMPPDGGSGGLTASGSGGDTDEDGVSDAVEEPDGEVGTPVGDEDSEAAAADEDSSGDASEPAASAEDVPDSMATTRDLDPSEFDDVDTPSEEEQAAESVAGPDPTQAPEAGYQPGGSGPDVGAGLGGSPFDGIDAGFDVPGAGDLGPGSHIGVQDLGDAFGADGGSDHAAYGKDMISQTSGASYAPGAGVGYMTGYNPNEGMKGTGDPADGSTYHDTNAGWALDQAEADINATSGRAVHGSNLGGGEPADGGGGGGADEGGGDGLVSHEFDNDDGSHTSVYENGDFITTYPDGRVEHNFAEDGRVETEYPDGKGGIEKTVTEYDDGSTKTVYADGRVETTPPPQSGEKERGADDGDGEQPPPEDPPPAGEDEKKEDDKEEDPPPEDPPPEDPPKNDTEDMTDEQYYARNPILDRLNPLPNETTVGSPKGGNDVDPVDDPAFGQGALEGSVKLVPGVSDPAGPDSEDFGAGARGLAPTGPDGDATDPPPDADSGPGSMGPEDNPIASGPGLEEQADATQTHTDTEGESDTFDIPDLAQDLELDDGPDLPVVELG